MFLKIISHYCTIKEKHRVYLAHLYNLNANRTINTGYMISRDIDAVRIQIALYCDIISNNFQELVVIVLALTQWQIKEMQSK